jgi:hypothetical protein
MSFSRNSCLLRGYRFNDDLGERDQFIEVCGVHVVFDSTQDNGLAGSKGVPARLSGQALNTQLPYGSSEICPIIADNSRPTLVRPISPVAMAGSTVEQLSPADPHLSLCHLAWTSMPHSPAKSATRFCPLAEAPVTWLRHAGGAASGVPAKPANGKDRQR